MTEAETPDIRKPFRHHGVVFNDNTNDTQYIAECPFCGKADHFYVNKENGLWDCKRCLASGDVSQFLLMVSSAYEKALTPRLIEKLSAHRQLPAEAFDGWHIGH